LLWGYSEEYFLTPATGYNKNTNASVLMGSQKKYFKIYLEWLQTQFEISTQIYFTASLHIHAWSIERVWCGVISQATISYLVVLILHQTVK
jgi:hypothetical protein